MKRKLKSLAIALALGAMVSGGLLALDNSSSEHGVPVDSSVYMASDHGVAPD